MTLARGDKWGFGSFGMMDHEDELFIAEPTTEREERRAALTVLDSLRLFNSIYGDKRLLEHLVLTLRILGLAPVGSEDVKPVALHCHAGHRLTTDVLVEADGGLVCLMCEDQMKKWAVYP